MPRDGLMQACDEFRCAVLRWNGSSDGQMSILRDVGAGCPVVVLWTGQTQVHESRYPVATSCKSATNDRNYYITNGHYIIGMHKVIIKRLTPLNWFSEGAVLSRWSYVCSWSVICQYSWCYQASTMIGRSFHHVRFTSRTSYEICNILYLNKWTYTFFCL